MYASLGVYEPVLVMISVSYLSSLICGMMIELKIYTTVSTFKGLREEFTLIENTMSHEREL